MKRKLFIVNLEKETGTANNNVILTTVVKLELCRPFHPIPMQHDYLNSVDRTRKSSSKPQVDRFFKPSAVTRTVALPGHSFELTKRGVLKKKDQQDHFKE